MALLFAQPIRPSSYDSTVGMFNDVPTAVALPSLCCAFHSLAAAE